MLIMKPNDSGAQSTFELYLHTTLEKHYGETEAEKNDFKTTFLIISLQW